MQFIVTDSVIFIQSKYKSELIQTGVNLGDITSELKPHKYISEFVSGGPKNYAYQLMGIKNASNQPKTVCKFRGITINYNASQVVNFDVIRDMI